MQDDLPEIGVGRVAEVAVVDEGVPLQRVALRLEDAPEPRSLETAEVGALLVERRRAAVGVGDEQDTPGAVVRERVVHDRVVASSRDRHARPDGTGGGIARFWRVAVVVVVHVVVDEDPARVRVGDGAGATVGAVPVLGRRRVAGDLGVGVDAILVVVELRVLDDDRAARIGARVAERVVLHPGVVDRDVAHLVAGTHVHARVVHVGPVDLVPARRALRVGREDPVLGRRRLVAEVGGRAGQVGARVPGQTDLPRPIASVPPHLVPRVARAAEEVAGREVLDAHVVRLPHHDPVAPLRLAADDRAEVLVLRVGTARGRGTSERSVHDDAVAIHSTDGQVRRVHDHASVVARAEKGGRRDVGVVCLVVVAGGDQDVIARLRSVHGGLNRRVLPGMAVVGADEQHRGRATARRARHQHRPGEQGGAQRAQAAHHDRPSCHGRSHTGRWASGGQQPFGPPGRTYSPACPHAGWTLRHR